jgi:hypothetical protein
MILAVQDRELPPRFKVTRAAWPGVGGGGGGGDRHDLAGA